MYPLERFDGSPVVEPDRAVEAYGNDHSVNRRGELEGERIARHRPAVDDDAIVDGAEFARDLVDTIGGERVREPFGSDRCGLQVVHPSVDGRQMEHAPVRRGVERIDREPGRHRRMMVVGVNEKRAASTRRKRRSERDSQLRLPISGARGGDEDNRRMGK